MIYFAAIFSVSVPPERGGLASNFKIGILCNDNSCRPAIPIRPQTSQAMTILCPPVQSLRHYERTTNCRQSSRTKKKKARRLPLRFAPLHCQLMPGEVLVASKLVEALPPARLQASGGAAGLELEEGGPACVLCVGACA